MAAQFVVYRTVDEDERSRFDRFMSQIERRGELLEWTGSSRFELDDECFFYFGRPAAAIVAIGRVAKVLEPRRGPFPWHPGTRRVSFFNYDRLRVLENPLHLPTEAARNARLRAWWDTQPFRNSRVLPSEVAAIFRRRIAEINGAPVASPSTRNGAAGARTGVPSRVSRHLEGAVREMLLEVRSRSAALRRAALAHHGYTCRICGTNLADIYGPGCETCVDVHHLQPLSSRTSETPTSVDDTIVVCPNCHRVLHRNGATPMPWQTLAGAVRRMRRQRGSGRA